MNKSLLGLLILSVSAGVSGCKDPGANAIPVSCQTAAEVAQILSNAGFTWNPQSDEALELTPDTLRVLLLNGNMTLLQGANRVHQAKENLNLARANLLPSINLGILLQSAASPTFLVSSVEFALPFLLPAKWFDMLAKKNLTKAEEMSFLALQLNQYSSLYALYLAIQSDYVAREFLAQDIQDALAVERIVSHSYAIGQATAADLDLARSSVLSAENRQLKLEELLTEEMASLRYSMAICPEVPLTLMEHEIPPSPLETETAFRAAEQVLEKSPESQQLNYLIRAAELERWGKVFGFMGGASVSGVAGSSGNALSNLDPKGSMSLGFGTIIGVSITNRNIEALQLGKRELGSETLKTLDSSLSRMGSIAARIERSARAERLLENVFDSEMRRYSNGETTLLSLTDAQGKLRTLRLETIRGRFDQRLERLNLHRLSRDEDFAKIKGCAGSKKAPEARVDGVDPCDSDFIKRKLGEKVEKQAAAPAA
ncbi:MAG: hypothetical protein A2X94_10590 [Bdellovibrionales bacterium GWB1_55_8]|nr:MAG: hypothetical protein A2X94_10590 [Bdellovibrionales bacterium GWB1_55_8]